MRIPFLLPLALAACASTYRNMPGLTAEMADLRRKGIDLPNEEGRVAGAEVAGEPVELYYRQTRARSE